MSKLKEDMAIETILNETQGNKKNDQIIHKL